MVRTRGSDSRLSAVATRAGNVIVMSDLRLAEQDLGVLVDEWIDWATAASLLGVTVGEVRTMIREHDIPALFIQDGLPVKGLSGLLHVLHDGRYDDREIIAWLFLDDDLPGRPIDALRENRGSEVKRRAQAMAL
jgi:hypothetical protein